VLSLLLRFLKDMSLLARTFRLAVLVTGILALVQAFLLDAPEPSPLFFAYLAACIMAGLFRVGVPTHEGTLSINFFFILVGISHFGVEEALLLGCAGALLHGIRAAKERRDWQTILFQVCVTALATEASSAVFARAHALSPSDGRTIGMPLAATALFMMTTFPLAAYRSLERSERLRKVWQQSYLWTLPYYLAGAAVSGLLTSSWAPPLWTLGAVLLPMLFLIYRAYRAQLQRLEEERRQAEDLSALQLGMIEALALSIEAKDSTTHDHLRRVTTYVMGIGKEMGLSESDLQALRAAALLHDIGKLAVPDHIISKPGRLSPEEFERLKVHPLVGAQIIERANFPYPVAPIVEAHHEKWDGSGYPFGLKGEQIPLGARILSAVDCLDALASDRQYRRGIPLDQAMATVSREAGRSFDPAVVAILQRNYREWEGQAKGLGRPFEPLAMDAKDMVTANAVPAAGFEPLDTDGPEAPGFLASIAAARREDQLIFELTQLIGNSLNLDETCSALAKRLQPLIPFDTLTLYVKREDTLAVRCVVGELNDRFAGMEVKLGEGVSGWVADIRKPILNANPAVEPGLSGQPRDLSRLKSALAVPLESAHGVAGVLTFYSKTADVFSREHLRILLAISTKLAIAVENSVKFAKAESMASQDFLTGLPNAGALFLHLQAELARCHREKTELCVLVCDLDGFKAVNDRFGHLAGNRVLQLVARGFKDHCREYDFVARLGGDEFVILLPGLSEDAAALRHRRFNQIAIDAGREVCGEDVLSLSIGEARFPRHGATPEQLLAIADEQMYHTKKRRKYSSEKIIPLAAAAGSA